MPTFTLKEIQSAEITKLSEQYWKTPSNSKYDEKIVADIYQKLRPQTILLLEINRYLENYLWAHLNEQNLSKILLISIIKMINEKCKEKIAAFGLDLFKNYTFFRNILINYVQNV